MQLKRKCSTFQHVKPWSTKCLIINNISIVKKTIQNNKQEKRWSYINDQKKKCTLVHFNKYYQLNILTPFYTFMLSSHGHNVHPNHFTLQYKHLNSQLERMRYAKSSPFQQSWQPGIIFFNTVYSLHHKIFVDKHPIRVVCDHSCAVNS